MAGEDDDSSSSISGAATAGARLENLLGYGRFQKGQVWFTASLVSFLGSIGMFQLLFTVTRKPFRCALPEGLENNFSFDAFENNSELVGTCEMASLRATSYCQTLNVSTVEALISTNCYETREQVPCQYGYIHDDTDENAFHSLSAENDWVCDKEGLGANLLLAQSIGIIFNGLIFMQISDTWGRRPVLQIVNFAYLASRVLILVFYNNYWVLLVVTAIGSSFYPVGERVAYIAVAEYTNEVGRLQLYIAGWIWWVLGVVFLSLMAWATGDWFTYGLVTSFLNLLVIPLFWLAPESPRLRLTQNRVAEADKIIRRIRKINKEESPPSMTAELAAIAAEISKEERSGVFSLFSCKRMILTTCLFCVTGAVNDFFYVGGQMNVENLAGNQFVNFALVGCSELPSVFIGQFMMNRIGRRWSHVICMTVATLLFGLCAPLSEDESLGWLVTTLAIAAKTVSNVGWFINYVQNVELFPTVARFSGISFCVTFAAVIGTSAPYLILLGAHDARLMYIIFALVGVLGIVAASFVQESYKQEFPECIADIAKRPLFPFFSFKVWEEAEENEHNKGTKA